MDSGFKVLGFGFFVSLRIPEPSIPTCNNTFILKLTGCCFFFFQSKVFSYGRDKVPEQPSVFLTAAHHRSCWTEERRRLCLVGGHFAIVIQDMFEGATKLRRLT